MQIDWTNAVNDVCTAVLTIAALAGVAKKWPKLFNALTFVEQHSSEIVKATETIVKDIAATPYGALVKHQLQAEVDKVTEQFKQSELARLALVGLHGFGQTVEGLSDTQKVALIRFVMDTAPSAWNLTEKEVQDVLDSVQKAASDFAEIELVKAANLFTAATQKTAVPAQEKPAG